MNPNAISTEIAKRVRTQYAGSSGGARPKVFVNIDGKEWLVKFKAALDPDNVGEIEFKHSLLAKKCGIDMSCLDKEHGRGVCPIPTNGL